MFAFKMLQSRGHFTPIPEGIEVLLQNNIHSAGQRGKHSFRSFDPLVELEL
jgi:hypothetical protein